MDTTLRDAHQSLWATRMTTAMMLPVAPGLGPKSVRKLIALANQNRRPDRPDRIDVRCTFNERKALHDHSQLRPHPRTPRELG